MQVPDLKDVKRVNVTFLLAWAFLRLIIRPDVDLSEMRRLFESHCKLENWTRKIHNYTFDEERVFQIYQLAAKTAIARQPRDAMLVMCDRAMANGVVLRGRRRTIRLAEFEGNILALGMRFDHRGKLSYLYIDLTTGEFVIDPKGAHDKALRQAAHLILQTLHEYPFVSVYAPYRPEMERVMKQLLA